MILVVHLGIQVLWHLPIYVLSVPKSGISVSAPISSWQAACGVPGPLTSVAFVCMHTSVPHRLPNFIISGFRAECMQSNSSSRALSDPHMAGRQDCRFNLNTVSMIHMMGDWAHTYVGVQVEKCGEYHAALHIHHRNIFGDCLLLARCAWPYWWQLACLHLNVLCQPFLSQTVHQQSPPPPSAAYLLGGLPRCRESLCLFQRCRCLRPQCKRLEHARCAAQSCRCEVTPRNASLQPSVPCR